MLFSSELFGVELQCALKTLVGIALLFHIHVDQAQQAVRFGVARVDRRSSPRFIERYRQLAVAVIAGGQVGAGAGAITQVAFGDFR